VLALVPVYMNNNIVGKCFTKVSNVSCIFEISFSEVTLNSHTSLIEICIMALFSHMF
jgi:hypothetical protein